MPVRHYVTMPILEFTNGLSTSVLRISVFPEPIDALHMLSRLHPLIIILVVLTGKILRRVETGKKITKSSVFFVPMAKQPRLTQTQDKENCNCEKGNDWGHCFNLYNNFSQHCSFLWTFIITYYKIFFSVRYTDPVYLQRECQTRVRNEYVTSATRVRHACDTSATRTSATQVKNFDFDSDTNKNMFSRPNISYMVTERLHGEEQFHSNNYLLEMPSHAKMRLKIAPQRLKFVMAKAISKCYTLDCSCKCPCTFPHSYK